MPKHQLHSFTSTMLSALHTAVTDAIDANVNNVAALVVDADATAIQAR